VLLVVADKLICVDDMCDCDCCLTDGADVLYNKLNVDSSSPQHPSANYSCVVAINDQWRVSRCDERHHVVCQSNHDTLPGIMIVFLLQVISSTSCIHWFQFVFETSGFVVCASITN